MATLHLDCPSCGQSATVQVVQAIGFENSLQWSEATVCQSCGYTVEADDMGFPPTQYRDSILKHEGVWCIRIEDVKSKVQVARVFRHSLDLSLGEGLKISKRIPGVVWSGTECEVDWLRNTLSEHGIDSVKERYLSSKQNNPTET